MLFGTVEEVTPDYLQEIRKYDHNALRSEVSNFSEIKRGIRSVSAPPLMRPEFADCQDWAALGPGQTEPAGPEKEASGSSDGGSSECLTLSEHIDVTKT